MLKPVLISHTALRLPGLTMSFTRNCYWPIRGTGIQEVTNSTTVNTCSSLHSLESLSRGVALSSRSELHQAMERRKRLQSDQEEEGQSRTPLENVLLRRQQKQLEMERKGEEKVREEAQLMEFVRVRQNLRKTQSAIQNKAGNI